MATINAIGNSIHLDAALGTDLTTSGQRAVFTANENQAFGDPVRIGTSSEAYLADASVIATARVIAMCCDATISADASGNYLMSGFIRQNTWAWSAPGVPIYLTITGTTTNCLSESVPTETSECVVLIGHAITADSMWFNPNNSIVELA